MMIAQGGCGWATTYYDKRVWTTTLIDDVDEGGVDNREYMIMHDGEWR